MTHGFSVFTCWTEGHTELLQEALWLLLLPPPPPLDVARCIPQRFPLCWCRLSPALSLHPSASQSASQPPAPSFIPNPSLSKEPTQKKPQSSWQLSWSCSSRLHMCTCTSEILKKPLTNQRPCLLLTNKHVDHSFCMSCTSIFLIIDLYTEVAVLILSCTYVCTSAQRFTVNENKANLYL